MNVAEELKKPLTAEEVAYLRQVHLSGGSVLNFPEDLVFRRDFAGSQMARDMTLFVDDDGTVYPHLRFGRQRNLGVSQLTDDYLRPAGKYVRMLPGEFQRGPGDVQARRQILPDHLGMQRLGTKRRQTGRGRINLGTVEGPGQPLRGQGCEPDFSWAGDLRAAP